MKPVILLFFSFWLSGLVLAGCYNDKKHTADTKPELLFYCGSTIRSAMREISDIFENKYNCIINIKTGGSEELYQSIKSTKTGDMYLPGSASYRTRHLSDGLLEDAVFVGYNQIALIVAAGNPKNITNDIRNLTRRDYFVGVGHPEIGSIGNYSKKLFDELGIYQEVMYNATSIVPDSRILTNRLKANEVNLILNWKATAYAPENRAFVEAIELDHKLATPQTLLLNLVTFSQEKKLARSFMQFVQSDKALKILRDNGFAVATGIQRIVE